MGNINATFCNNYSEKRMWWIWDIKSDPNVPPKIFEGYLEPNQCTDSLPLYTGDDLWGQAMYQRSDGAQNIVDTITEGSTVQME
jgi:hypothetical protein